MTFKRQIQKHGADPTTWVRFEAVQFSLTESTVPFTDIGIDQGQEFLVKVLKGERGLGGITFLTKKTSKVLSICTRTKDLHGYRMSQTGFASSRTHRHDLSPVKICEVCCPKSYNYATLSVQFTETLQPRD